jgi:serine/threonine protein kinase
MKPLSPNVLIQDRYLIVHLIGKGGMGEVYLAVDQRLGSAVALKRTFFSDDEMLANAFEREARILANLRHPILPKVSDHFIDGENQFLVMEHITGDDLSKRLEKTQQPFPLSWVLFWADQLLDALHYLHTHEPPIIHRDIKPQNLKLTNDNHIVLLDFGLSKNSVGETRTSSSGSIVGYTPHYAPMEQIRGTGTNAQSDLYSLSATVYQLITNTVPPDALTRADSLLSGLPDPIKPINEINKEVTPEVSEVILKGMDIRQDSRHASAREMQRSLRDAYSKLQNAMSAQTMAFNVSAEELASADESAEAPIPSEPLPESQSDSDEFAGSATFGKDNGLETSDGFQAASDFETSGDSLGPQPSEIKTEVLLGGQVPAIVAAQQGTEIPIENEFSSETVDREEFESFGTANEIDIGDSFATTSNEPSGDSFSTRTSDTSFSGGDGENGFEEVENAFDGVGGHGDTEFFSNIEVDEDRGSGATFISPSENNSGDLSVPIVASKPLPQVDKSGGGKKIALVLGLLALLFIIVGAVGGVGWYAYKNGMLGGQGTPAPTPEPTLAITPTVEPTVEETPLNNNVNVENLRTNTNSEVEIGGSNANAKPTVPTATPTARPTPSPGKIIVTPTPFIKPTPPKPSPTPKKTPTPGGILQ